MKKHSLVIIIGLGLLLRVAVALYLGNSVAELPAIADQISYHTLATRLIDGQGFTFDTDWWPATKAGQPTAHWSYLYTLYLALVYSLFGKSPLAARLIQVVAGGVMLPWLVYRITKRIFPGRLLDDAGALVARFPRFNWLNRLWQDSRGAIPLLAALWMAFYGYFIYFAAALMTETFYIIGILWTLDCSLRIVNNWPKSMIRQQITNRWQKIYFIIPWIELGIAISITAMLRQVFLPFVPFLILWLWWAIFRQERQSLSDTKKAFSHTTISLIQYGLFTLAVIILLIAPVTLFNYHQFGRFVLLNTNAGYALYWSNHPIYGNSFIAMPTADMPTYYDMLPQELLWMDEASLDQALLRRGVGFIMDDPIRYIRLSISRIPGYYTFWPLPDSNPISNIVRVLSYGFALPFILAGIFLWGSDAHRRQVKIEPGVLLLLFGVVYSLIHLLSWAGIRYRLPVDAVTLAFAARGLFALGHSVLFKK